MATHPYCAAPASYMSTKKTRKAVADDEADADAKNRVITEKIRNKGSNKKRNGRFKPKFKKLCCVMKVF